MRQARNEVALREERGVEEVVGQRVPARFAIVRSPAGAPAPPYASASHAGQPG
jgi:hypothetical protein